MDFKKDFPMLNKDIIYFDNGATTLKPYSVINEIKDYYENYSSNAHRGDYKISVDASLKFEETREKVRQFINANKKEEIVFTSGSTESINEIIFGYLGEYLNENDEVLTTKSEHASIILPLFELEKSKRIKVKFMPLKDDFTLDLNTVKNSVTDRTKAICISHVTNVIGDIRPIKEIVKYAHEKGIIVLLDASQSIGHIKVDVGDLDVDFMAFSAHKMLGPTGVGVLYGKYELLDKVKPLIYGGGMNVSFTNSSNIELKSLPHRLEAGTQNIAGVIGFSKAIDYINDIGIDSIENKIIELKRYAVDKLKRLKNVEIYNENVDGSTIIFNVKGIFSQDVSIYLDKYNICIRSGSHCAKKLVDELGITNTCRISLYFYNTKEEIDRLVEVLDNDHILEESIGV